MVQWLCCELNNLENVVQLVVAARDSSPVQMSRPALVPTQPPTIILRGALYLEAKSLGHKAERSSTSDTEVMNVLNYISTPP